MSLLPSSPQPIRITRTVYDSYRQTIAKHPPETFALLGGRLDDYVVTDFRFCPPARDASGRFDVSRSHINLDPDFLNWIVDNEWKPNGKYLVGFWHSHPGSASQPSIGDARTNQGDVAFFSACLAADDSPKRNWHTCLCPITTFAADGSDTIHGWMLNRGEAKPRACEVVIEDASQRVCITSHEQRAREAYACAELKLELVRDLLRRYARETTIIGADPSLCRDTRRQMTNALLKLRDAELRDLCAGTHPLASILAPFKEPPPHA